MTVVRGGASSVVYAPSAPPSDPVALNAYLNEEFSKIAVAIGRLAAGHVDTSYAAPDKPREGDLRLADGTHWDPVSAGAPRFVGYAGGAWRLLG